MGSYLPIMKNHCNVNNIYLSFSIRFNLIFYLPINTILLILSSKIKKDKYIKAKG